MSDNQSTAKKAKEASDRGDQAHSRRNQLLHEESHSLCLMALSGSNERRKLAMPSPDTAKLPGWCCPYCGKPVGYLGCLLAKIMGVRIHGCDFSVYRRESIHD